MPIIGRVLLSISGLAAIIGPFAADFNETHVLNPNWPGHARFHNGQTMSMGLGLGLATLYYTWRDQPTAAARKEGLFTALLFSSLYWATGMSAILYPGSLGVDKEFGEGFPQLPLFAGLLVSGLLGWAVERRGFEERRKLM